MLFSTYSGREVLPQNGISTAEKRILTLMVTCSCNLHCSYCYQKGSHDNTLYMNFDTARRVIDDFFCKLKKNELGVIDLIGGEPFLVIGMLSQITEYVIKNHWEKLHNFALTTNGTILASSDEVKNWVSYNKKKLFISVSIDGDKKTHDSNRCMSYDKAIASLNYLINIGMRNNTSIKMTIGPNSICSIFKGTCSLHKFGVKISSNVVFEDVWGNKEEKAKLVATFRQELLKLVNFYLERPELAPSTLVCLPITLLGLKNRKWCGSGKLMEAIDVTGKKYPCHRSITEKISIKVVDSDKLSNANNQCVSCVFVNACPHCEVFNLSENGNISSRTNYHCEFIKSQLVAAARLTYGRLKDKINTSPSELTDDELQRLRGVVFVSDHIDLLL